MTVLLVDDDDGVRDLLERALRTHGYTVLPAASAEDAESIMGTTVDRLDLLVCDVCLPGMSGTDLARQLAARHVGLRTVLMSGDPSMDAVARDAGTAVTFLAKPFTTVRFLETVRTALGR